MDCDGGRLRLSLKQGRAMARMKMVGALLLIVYVSLVGAQIHHVVGGDRGSTKASEVQEWLFD